MSVYPPFKVCQSNDTLYLGRDKHIGERRTVGPRIRVLHRNVQRFRGGLVFKAHRLLYRSTLGLRVIKKKKGSGCGIAPAENVHDQRGDRVDLVSGL